VRKRNPANSNLVHQASEGRDTLEGRVALHAIFSEPLRTYSGGDLSENRGLTTETRRRGEKQTRQ
jgi:hypothetical protein